MMDGWRACAHAGRGMVDGVDEVDGVDRACARGGRNGGRGGQGLRPRGEKCWNNGMPKETP